MRFRKHLLLALTYLGEIESGEEVVRVGILVERYLAGDFTMDVTFNSYVTTGSSIDCVNSMLYSVLWWNYYFLKGDSVGYCHEEEQIASYLEQLAEMIGNTKQVLLLQGDIFGN